MTTLLITFFFSVNASTIVGIADDAIVMKNNSLIFDVLENDEIDGEILSFGIEIHPTFGDVVINEDRTVTYKPFENICEESDYFFYYIEDSDGPKLVEVNIDILCEPLTVLNGFYQEPKETPESPNSFTILGVENFPNNSLYVFSDNGEEVYYTQGYDNNWSGKDKESDPIELNRIYYYVFNDGQGGTYCGYVQMN